MWMKREVQVGGASVIEKITLSTFGRDKARWSRSSMRRWTTASSAS